MNAGLRALRKHFLPPQFSVTGTYNPRWHNLAAGYRLLAHAEIEACLEAIATAASARCVHEWKYKHRIGLTTVSLIALLPRLITRFLKNLMVYRNLTCFQN